MDTTKNTLVLSGEVCAAAHPRLNKDVLKEFWKNFTFQASSLNLSEKKSLEFTVGDTEPIPLNDAEYTLRVDEKGIALRAVDEKNLVRGFMTLLNNFRAVEQDETTAAELTFCSITDRARIQTRMVHFCVFPETELWELQRFLRFCGALKYTHVVLEFWGMLRYDCMKELSWSHGFSKEQLRPLLREATELGLEIVPMFNHWGHASAGRVMHGKHVVLDQNPALQTYFSDDGWCWDLRKEKVRNLLREIRRELIDLCGEGSYFHIGCDEAYAFDFTEENTAFLCDFLNEIGDELHTEGRRAILWGDMFLYRHAHYNPKNKYTCNAPSEWVERYFLTHLNKNLVIADWQYDSPCAPVETASVFKNAGFDCLLCPWDTGVAHTVAAMETVTGTLEGFIHTTWHTLSAGMPYVLLAAALGFDGKSPGNRAETRTKTATLLRKVLPAQGIYERAGWSKEQVGYKW